MLSYREANNIIENEILKINLEIEEVDLLDSLNRILAEDVFADVSLPQFNNSAVDGYAVKYNSRHRRDKSEILKWKIIGEITAGNFNAIDVDENSAVLIMTGSKIPSACDTIIPVEDVITENGFVKLTGNTKCKPGQNVRKKAEDITSNDLAVQKRTFILPQHISLLAACGKNKVKVYRQLKIGVLSTGDELVDIHTFPKEDKIRATNLYTLLALIKQLNMIPVNYGFVKDCKDEIKVRIESALNSEIDILLTTGGVSVGKFDYVKEIIQELGVEIKFWRTNIKPGKPIVFGVFEREAKKKLILGLPGNPVSSFVNFIIFAQDNIKKLYGMDEHKVRARLTSELHKKDNKRHFIRGFIQKDRATNQHSVSLIGSQSSGNMVGMSKANCLIVFEEGKENLTIGEIVECIMI
ncbi:MAG: molybdopterin molybdotransferase MoeA [Bacteroidetes bacterium]|nr:molybdopterin molybdotransferase MoeA [Bacteroidota bacterium]